jgi:5-methylcytosine-specific restriction endonuclease McrA
MSVATRACNECRQEFPRTPEFWSRQKRNTDGLDGSCKGCAKKRAKLWYHANRERGRAQSKDYRERNHEAVLAQRRKYRRENLAKVLAADRAWEGANVQKRIAYTAQWRLDHPDKAAQLRKREYENGKDRIKQRSREWYEANRQKALARAADYRKRNTEQVQQRKRQEYLRHRDKRKAKVKEWAANNPAKVQANRARHQALLVNAPGHFTPADLKEQHRKQAGLCFYCHAELHKLGSVDHVIPLSKRGTNLPENIDLACWPCNNRKGDMMPDQFLKYLQSIHE